MVLKTFGKLIKKGMVYRGDRPVFWSVQNQRVLAEDEITLKTEIR
jgi:isoleucyl-tRNA synthetase